MIIENIKAWPFEEARKISKINSEKETIVFQTGYGPSGLPHIGTFSEVFRTTLIRNAFEKISPEKKTKLICFSDDLDGLRKVPENIPNPEKMEPYLGKPLTQVPDPFGEYASFGESNNERLKKFLDGFDFLDLDYEFQSSTHCYQNGIFNEVLKRVLKKHQEIREIILPSLGQERKQSYSPFLPISPLSGKVLQTSILELDPEKNTILFKDENGQETEISILDGKAKLQWKADWAMRWVAFGVDYEMFGKDLIDSVKHSSKIARVLDGRPPIGMSYEHFLDSEGQKISKSKGNGISVEEWLEFAPQESLAYFMYAKPKTAKRLHFEVIPVAVDAYFNELQENSENPEKAVFHIHAGKAPKKSESQISYRMILNLAAVSNAQDSKTLWKFLQRYSPNTQITPELDSILASALRFYQKVLKSEQVFYQPNPEEKAAILKFRDALQNYKGDPNPEDLQKVAYQIGNSETESLREWFKLLYKTLLGYEQGPRFGAFVAIYGVQETIDLINETLQETETKR